MPCVVHRHGRRFPDRTHGGVTLGSLLVEGGTLVCMDAAGTVLEGDLLVVDEGVPVGEENLPVVVARAD